MNPIIDFENQKRKNIELLSTDANMKDITSKWIIASANHQYTYNFSWLGRPIIQFPQDILAVQEIVWNVKPDLIIETGIAHGGSLIFYASMLELIGGKGNVLGIDIDIRRHNKIEIEKHRMFKRINMIEGSSISEKTIQEVKNFIRRKKKIMVVLDSDHTHNHVLKELELYSPFVSKDSYLIVFDTAIEDYAIESYNERPWGKGNNPKTAVWEFLKTHQEFEIDKNIENKLVITVAPDGYLKRVK
jgi:cephalosporin hydroxylase